MSSSTSEADRLRDYFEGDIVGDAYDPYDEEYDYCEEEEEDYGENDSHSHPIRRVTIRRLNWAQYLRLANIVFPRLKAQAQLRAPEFLGPVWESVSFKHNPRPFLKEMYNLHWDGRKEYEKIIRERREASTTTRWLIKTSS